MSNGYKRRKGLKKARFNPFRGTIFGTLTKRLASRARRGRAKGVGIGSRGFNPFRGGIFRRLVSRRKGSARRSFRRR